MDGVGNAYVTGTTGSTNFPTLNAFQSDQPEDDVFVVKVNTNVSGSASLLYSTYLGGDLDERASDIAVDGAGNAYVTGTTSSTDFPTRNQYQTDQLNDDGIRDKVEHERERDCVIGLQHLPGWK